MTFEHKLLEELKKIHGCESVACPVVYLFLKRILKLFDDEVIGHKSNCSLMRAKDHQKNCPNEECITRTYKECDCNYGIRQKLYGGENKI